MDQERRVLEDVWFEENEGLQLVCWTGKDCLGPVVVKRPFPLKGPRELIVVSSVEGKFLGLIKDYRRLDPGSVALVESHLDRQHYMPEIVGIKSIGEEGGVWIWKTITDRGERDFVVRSRRRDVTWLSDHHLVVRDADGNKYEIRDFRKLDENSRDKSELEV